VASRSDRAVAQAEEKVCPPELRVEIRGRSWCSTGAGIDCVDLTVHEGECAPHGPNGAGKNTADRCGTATKQPGQRAVRRTELVRPRANTRSCAAGVGRTFQTAHVEELTVAENLALEGTSGRRGAPG